MGTLDDINKRKRVPWIYSSEPVPLITLNVGPADVSGPDIVVSGLPVGVTVVQAVGKMKIRMIRNTDLVQPSNYISTDQTIEIRKAPVGSYTPLIDLKNTQWTIPRNTTEGGDSYRGVYNVKNIVDGNATYNTKFAAASTFANSILLKDTVFELEIYII